MIQLNIDPLLHKNGGENIWYHLFLKGSHMLPKSSEATEGDMLNHNPNIAQEWHLS